MRIVWTREEKQALQHTLIDIIAFNRGMTNKELLSAAQAQCLPIERRQKITDQKVFTHKGMINEARETVARAAKRADTFTKPPEPPAPEPRKLDTLGQVFELFIDALADRIIDKMIKAKEEHEKANEPSITLEELDKTFDRLYPLWKNAPLEPNKPRRPTCLVIGLNGAQMESIKQRVKGVDFKFLSAEEAQSHYVSVKDHTVLMTKFINHQCQSKYRKHPNLHYCNGGVSELNTLLNGIFNKE